MRQNAYRLKCMRTAGRHVQKLKYPVLYRTYMVDGHLPCTSVTKVCRNTCNRKNMLLYNNN